MKQSDCNVKLTSSEDGSEIDIKITTEDKTGMTVGQILKSMLAIYDKFADDHDVEPVSFFCEEMGIPHHIQTFEEDSGVIQ